MATLRQCLPCPIGGNPAPACQANLPSDSKHSRNAHVPHGGPYPGEYAVWLKGWSENEGVPKALADAGIVTLTGRLNLAGFAEAEHAELTERARTALDAKREGLTATAHREVDELLKLGVIGEHRAAQLKRLLITEAIEDHDQDGMSIREIVDMYRDVIEPT